MFRMCVTTTAENDATANDKKLLRQCIIDLIPIPAAESADPIIHKIRSILVVLAENVILTAEKYVSASKRNAITETDLMYAMKYEAHVFFFRPDFEHDVNVTMQQCAQDNATNANESQNVSSEEENLLEDDEDKDEDKDDDDDDDDDDEFERCEVDTFCKTVNQMVDTWENWNPQDILQQRIKQIIDDTFA